MAIVLNFSMLDPGAANPHLTGRKVENFINIKILKAVSLSKKMKKRFK
jgi:hypothetical protein